MRYYIKFIICVAGIYSCFLSTAFLEEKLYSYSPPYPPIDTKPTSAPLNPPPLPSNLASCSC